MIEKRFTTDNGSNEDVCLVDNVTKKEYESNFMDIVDLMNELAEENGALKELLILYRKFFKEFQKQMSEVKIASDLDSKDFDDLLELSKGNVFDDKIGWIHLPIKELEND